LGLPWVGLDGLWAVHDGLHQPHFLIVLDHLNINGPRGLTSITNRALSTLLRALIKPQAKA